MTILSKEIHNSSNPDIAGSSRPMQRAGQVAFNLAIQTNAAIVTIFDGKVMIPASKLIN